MKVLSVNVGLPRQAPYRGKLVWTGIFKEPVANAVKVNEFNLEGDKQADLTVHGGYFKAVYAYPSEHYDFWRAEFPEMDLPFGMFGENLTTEGILESDAVIGDRLRIGTAEFIVTQPRVPCFKLGIRFGRFDILRRFAKSGRSGFYLAVDRQGALEAGDHIEFLGHDERNIQLTSIADINVERAKIK
jgi:MOSC domain-containing protein YiiM